MAESVKVRDLSYKAKLQSAVVHARLTSEIKTLAGEWQEGASWRARHGTPLEEARHDFISRDVRRNCCSERR